MARAEAALSPVMRTIRPQRVLASAHHMKTGKRDADEEERIDLERLRDRRGLLAQPPSGIASRRGAVRLDEGLAEEEGEAGAERS